MRICVDDVKDSAKQYMGEIQGKPMTAGIKLVSAVDETIETGTAFGARAMGWWNRWILQKIDSLEPRTEPYHILATSHGGLIGTLVNNLVHSRKAKCGPGVVIYKCFNSSVTIIEVGQDRKGVIVQYSDVSHLQERAVEKNADEVEEA